MECNQPSSISEPRYTYLILLTWRQCRALRVVSFRRDRVDCVKVDIIVIIISISITSFIFMLMFQYSRKSCYSQLRLPSVVCGMVRILYPATIQMARPYKQRKSNFTNRKTSHPPCKDHSAARFWILNVCHDGFVVYLAEEYCPIRLRFLLIDSSSTCL